MPDNLWLPGDNAWIFQNPTSKTVISYAVSIILKYNVETDRF